MNRQILNFLWVGGLNTLVGYALYAFFIFLDIRFFLALLLATGLGVVFNFFTIGRIVFKQSNSKLFFKFTAMYIFLYFLGLLFIQILKKFHINLYLSGFISVITLSMLSFTLNKYFVFSEKKEVDYGSEKETLC